MDVKKINEIKDEIGINEEDLAWSKEAANNEIKNKNLSYLKEKMKRTGNEKTKVRYLLEGKGDRKPGHRPVYISKLTRNQASIIFQGRTRILNVKLTMKMGKITYYAEGVSLLKKHSTAYYRNVRVFIKMIHQN